MSCVRSCMYRTLHDLERLGNTGVKAGQGKRPQSTIIITELLPYRGTTQKDSHSKPWLAMYTHPSSIPHPSLIHPSSIHPSIHSASWLSPVSVFSPPSGLPLAEPSSVLVLLWLGSIWDFSRSNASARSVRFLEQRFVQGYQKIKV